MSNTGDILLIEDHRDIAEMVYDYLEGEGYSVDYADNGATGLRFGCDNDYDVVILDLMLPGIDGLEVCRRLRSEAQSAVPVLMLTARDTLEDKLAGFDSGADDYLVKPFDLEELGARVRVLARRRPEASSASVLRAGELEFDQRTLRVTRAGQELTVTPIGLKILSVLMQRSPGIVSRQEVEQAIWGDLPPDSDALRSHMYTLRKSVDRPFEHAMIRTVAGAGFRLDAEP